jgi:signal transduction histidine kinase
MAIIGRFSAGIAHEVKNLLSPIMLAELIKKDYADDAAIQEYTGLIMEAHERILSIVSEIRDFAKGGETAYETRPLDLAAVVDSALHFLQYDKEVRRAEIVRDFRAHPVVEMNENKIKQALINLVRNAVQALPPAGGKVKVTVRADLAAAYIDVKDTGCGIPAEIRDHVFDPFFSWRKEGGLGLGLDICRKIVERHGGTIACQSEIGVGTTMTITLPLKAATIKVPRASPPS